jgi:glycine/D-amino acid oxidase-like deaminating enzyme/nitrite reductase/ring-hydroxylating ferredoxin subunit
MYSLSNDQLSSGENQSFWIDSVRQNVYETLEKDIKTDVLVIGGGIAGLTTAYCLALAGKQVVLIEDGLLGSGETGRTTAHLTHALDDRYFIIEKLFGEEKSKLAAESHTAAIDWIENTVRREFIDCEFKRIEGYLFLHPSDSRESLEKELKATKKAGLNTEMLSETPGLLNVNSPCLRFTSQGQFHIMKYLNGLAKAFVEKAGKIYTNTHASRITEHVVTANGFRIEAASIVVATNTPVNDIVTMHTKQFPYRTYVIGCTIPKNTLQPALWWDTGDQDSKWITSPYHYVRLQSYNEEFDLLIAGGEDHKTGQADKEDIPEENRYTKLIEWTRQLFPSIVEIKYRWSGQVMEPLDSLAFIGKNPGNENVYIITGDSGNGMTHGTLGGMIITDMILGRENKWAQIYKPTRIPLKVAGKYLKEAMNMAAQYADWVSKEDIDKAQQLLTGEGGIISSGLRKIAAYKDETGQLHLFSAACPHLGCVVQWNADEKSFDCPCHGSRFTAEGKVINGPAIEDLKAVEMKEEHSLTGKR